MLLYTDDITELGKRARYGPHVLPSSRWVPQLLPGPGMLPTSSSATTPEGVAGLCLLGAGDPALLPSLLP